MDRRVTYTYVSSGHSKLIYTENEDAFFLTARRIPFNNLSEYHRPKHEYFTFCNGESHFDHTKKRPVCTSVYVSEIHHYPYMYRS